VAQPRLSVHADVGLHDEIPLIAFLRLVHLRIMLLLFVLGRGRGGDDGGINAANFLSYFLQHSRSAALQRQYRKG
jgi:hypothetical protein